MKKKILFISMFLLASTPTFASKKYDCSNEELASYIEQASAPLNMTTGISKPKDFTEALIQTRAEENAASGKKDECFNIWSGDIDLDEEWKKLMEAFDKINFDFSFSGFGGFDFSSILNKIGKLYDKAMEDIMEELNKGFCERVSEVDWKKIGGEAKDYFVGKIDKKYGYDLDDDSWWSEAMKKEMKGEFGDIGEYVFDPDELSEDLDSETKRKLKKVDKDFWDDI